MTAVKVDLKEILFKKREEKRKQYEEILNAHTGDKLVLDKALLNELLFEDVMIKFSDDKENGHLAGRKIRAKIIVWSGPFLSKVNLEEINFDNVIWDIEDFIGNYSVEDFKIEKESIEEIKRVTKGRYRIDLSNTNATIEFSKSFWGSLGMAQYITSCDFINVDLSNNTLNQVCIWDSNFQNTGIKICNNQFYSEEQIIAIINSHMEGTDLSECTVYGRYVDSNLKDTGLRIITSPEMQKEEAKKLGEAIKAGRLDGCYVNNTYIESKEARRAKAQKIADELKNPEIEEFEELLSTIDIIEHKKAAKEIIQILIDAINDYKKTQVIENRNINLSTTHFKKVTNALEKRNDNNEINKIILHLVNELEKGYNEYLSAKDKSEIGEDDSRLTLQAGIKILKAKRKLLAIIKERESTDEQNKSIKK